MSFSPPIKILPSFSKHYDVEFCRQLLLKHFSSANLFFDPHSKVIHDFLIELIKLPGSDPIRDVPRILFKWSCICFYNRIKPPKVNPSVPLDFSFIHPELSNFDVFYSYALKEDQAANLIRLNDTFPYEFFKVISMLKPEDAQLFSRVIGFNRKVPIHLCGRIISMFPLSIVTVDFSKIFLKRCYKSYEDFSSFFEGLLCNADYNLSQITAAQLLSDHFDDLLTSSNPNFADIRDNQCLQLINTSIRKMTHFLDNNMALSTHLFPTQCTTLSFLLQISVAPFSIVSKAVKNLPHSEYITRFNNQMKLMQVIGLGENWRKLEENSIPFLVGSEQLPLIPVLLTDIPRTSRFLTLPSSDYQKDYDFIHAYLIFVDFIANQKLKSKESLTSLLEISDSLFTSKYENEFFSNLSIDIFSLLFLKKNYCNDSLLKFNKNDYFDVLERRKSNSLSEFALNENTLSHPLKSGSTNYLTDFSNSEFVFDADTALSVVTILLSNEKIPDKLKPFLIRADIRLRCSLSLFERPVKLEAVLLPQEYFYLHGLTSLELIDMLIRKFGNPPSFVLSRRFSLLVSKSLFLKDRTINENEAKLKSSFNPFSDRLSIDKPLSKRTEEIFDEVLDDFPAELRPLLILDFVSSHKKFTTFSQKVKDDSYSLFVKKLMSKSSRYPHGQVLDLVNSKSLDELQKKLCSIMSFKNSNNKNLLVTWCAFLFLLTSIRSQSIQKFLKNSTESQILEVINSTETVQSAVELFQDTGIDVLKILFKMKNSSNLLKEKLIIGLIKFEPLFGIPFSINTSVNTKKIIEGVGDKKDDFRIVLKYLNSKNNSNLSNSFDFLNENDKNKFLNSFEDKVDLLIKENKILLFLQKLNSGLVKDVNLQEKAMLILDYLIYKFDFSSHFELILQIISHCPKEWSINFIETFVSLIDPSNETALFPLQQQLSELKPLTDFNQMDEMTKVCTCWDYLIKEVTRFKNIVKQPEKFYRLCSLHLMHHEVGRSLITHVQLFTKILLYVRSYHIFVENGQYDNESENKWISKYLKYGISSLKESVLAEMTIDIGMNYNFECGLSISKYFNSKFDDQISALPPSIRGSLLKMSNPDSELKNLERFSSCSLINFKMSSSISSIIKQKLPLSVDLIIYAHDPQKLAEEVLSEVEVNSVEDEEELLHLLVKMKKFDFISQIRLFEILDTFCHYFIYSRFSIPYSGKSLTGLRDVAELCDLLNGNEVSNFQLLFDGIEISESLRKKLNDCYSIFGLIQKNTSLDKKLMFVCPIEGIGSESFMSEISRSLSKKLMNEQNNRKSKKSEKDLNNFTMKETISFINESSRQSFEFSSFSAPNIFSISFDGSSLMIFHEHLRQSDSKAALVNNFATDFRFFDIDCKMANGKPQLRISPDSHSAITETIAFSEVKKIPKSPESFQIKRNKDSLNDFDLFNSFHEAVINSSLFDLFDVLNFDEMQRILRFSNERSLIFTLLQITIWVQEHQEYFGIFVYPGSALENRQKTATNSDQAVKSSNELIKAENDESSLFLNFSQNPLLCNFDAAKVLDFIFALKLTLISAIRIADDVSPSSLFPPSIITSGLRNRLDDLCLAIEHQLQIGVSNLNLFEETAVTGNVAHVIAQVFVDYDYDRGFALTRVFHADIDEVMIEAAALVASKQKNSQEQLVQFLLAVLPKLSSNSFNQLIQTLSSILVRNKSNEHFIKLIINGIENPKNAYQMLRCFGYDEAALNFALTHNLPHEVETSFKDASKKGLIFAARTSYRWILQHKQQNL